MTPEANTVLTQYYQIQRGALERDAARTTVRLLESLRRLAEGHARFMYRECVLLHDAIIAVSLVDASMQTSPLFPGGNTLHTMFPDDPLAEYRAQGEI